MKLLVTLGTDESGMIVAECPAIPGCASQGRTEAEALENIREAIVGCLQTRAANNMPLTIAVREIEVPALRFRRAGRTGFPENGMSQGPAARKPRYINQAGKPRNFIRTTAS